MTCNFQAGLSITSPYGSNFTYDATGQDPDDNLLGGNDDENYFEYVFTLNTVTCTDDGSCDTMTPSSIRVTGTEQYFTLWICDSTTSRISVRNSSGQFKVGETITAPNGATGTVKEWHNFREVNGLDIIELDNPSGNFPSETVTGSESGVTADCVAGWFDSPGSTLVGGVTVTTEPVVATLSGFYAYPKKVSYTKYLSPKCDTLVDVCGPIAETHDETKGWMEMFEDGPDTCDFKQINKQNRELLQDEWGKTTVACSRESTWPINADTGVYVAVPLLGEDANGNPLGMQEYIHPGLQEKMQKSLDNYNKQMLSMCDSGGITDMQQWVQLEQSLTDPVDLAFQADYIIDGAQQTYVNQMDANLNNTSGNSAEFWREIRTYNCQFNDLVDGAIAAEEHAMAIEANQQTIVPQNWYTEKMQEWSTSSFRGVPSAGPRIKWNIFEYVPHSRGRQEFPYTIVGGWYCSDLLGTNVGTTDTFTYNINLEINSNWSTYRDLLAEAVERQGNPYDDVLIAQIKAFVDPSHSTITLFDYDITNFPDYGYLELNNYEYAGQGISAITALDPGLGYMNAPTVTFSDPDLPGGTLATAEAVVTGGRIYGYKLTNEGSGYIQSPIITVSAPNPALSAVADVVTGSSYMINIDMDAYPLLFMGITVQDDLGQMDVRSVKRSVPGVEFQCTADGTDILVVNTVYIESNQTASDIDIDDIQAGMIIEGFDDPTIYVQQVTLAGATIQVSQNIAAGTYRVNTKTAIQMSAASNTTLTGVDFTFTAPQVSNATAYTRLFLQSETGSSFTYENSREIAHFDGKTANEDGSVTLNNLLRTRKQTEGKQHLRNDHTFLHIYV